MHMHVYLFCLPALHACPAAPAPTHTHTHTLPDRRRQKHAHNSPLNFISPRLIYVHLLSYCLSFYCCRCAVVFYCCCCFMPIPFLMPNSPFGNLYIWHAVHVSMVTPLPRNSCPAAFFHHNWTKRCIEPRLVTLSSTLSLSLSLCCCSHAFVKSLSANDFACLRVFVCVCVCVRDKNGCLLFVYFVVVITAPSYRFNSSNNNCFKDNDNNIAQQQEALIQIKLPHALALSYCMRACVCVS